MWSKFKERVLNVIVFIVIFLCAWPFINYLVAFELAPVFWNTHTSSGVDFAVGLWLLSIISLYFNVVVVWLFVHGDKHGK